MRSSQINEPQLLFLSEGTQIPACLIGPWKRSRAVWWDEFGNYKWSARLAAELEEIDIVLFISGPHQRLVKTYADSDNSDEWSWTEQSTSEVGDCGYHSSSCGPYRPVFFLICLFSWDDSSSVSSGLSDTLDNISTDDLNTPVYSAGGSSRKSRGGGGGGGGAQVRT